MWEEQAPTRVSGLGPVTTRAALHPRSMAPCSLRRRLRRSLRAARRTRSVQSAVCVGPAVTADERKQGRHWPGSVMLRPPSTVVGETGGGTIVFVFSTIFTFYSLRVKYIRPTQHGMYPKLCRFEFGILGFNFTGKCIP